MPASPNPSPSVGSGPPRPGLPPWLRRPLPVHPQFARTRSLLAGRDLNTVCESARCPNRWECWSAGTAAVMIAGDQCTRACGFCAVRTGRPQPLDPGEPLRVALAARDLGLRHLVVTAVARDDLPDGGSAHFAQAIRSVRRLCPSMVIEALIPDFRGSDLDLGRVLEAGPDILNHNLETVERLTPRVRSRATYRGSLELIGRAARRPPRTAIPKSGLMLGLGEREEEVAQAMEDLREAGCEILSLGQYLPPSGRHHRLARYVPPGEFEELARAARRMGFLHVASGPLVRSSYHADQADPDLLRRLRRRRGSRLTGSPANRGSTRTGAR